MEDKYKNKFLIAQESIVQLMISHGYSAREIIECCLKSVSELILEDRVRNIDPDDVELINHA